MNKVSIIGFGRFGAMLHALLSKGFEVDVFDKNPINNTEINEVSFEDALKNETIFIAVPIRDFEELIVNISDKIESGKTLIDVCSVKVFPKKVMKDNLPTQTDIIATHPLFGPDSLKDSGSVMTMESVRNNFERYDFWKNYFKSQNITIEEIHSHEQALKQCKDYLAEKFWSKKLVEEDDTAKAAQDLAEGRLPKQVAVIASKFSAKKYGINILENDIHDLKRNLTLFMAVKRLDS